MKMPIAIASISVYVCEQAGLSGSVVTFSMPKEQTTEGIRRIEEHANVNVYTSVFIIQKNRIPDLLDFYFLHLHERSCHMVVTVFFSILYFKKKGKSMLSTYNTYLSKYEKGPLYCTNFAELGITICFS
jgi:hypothetical protein